MQRAADVRGEIEKRESVDQTGSCPLAPTERCGLTDIGPNALCSKCISAYKFFEDFIRITRTGQTLEMPPVIQEKIDLLMKKQEISTGNTINDEYVSNLISLFLGKIVDYIQRHQKYIDEIPTEDLLFLHALLMLKEKVDKFRMVQDVDIDQGLRAVIEDLIKTIKNDIIETE